MIILRTSLTSEIYIAALNHINKGTAEDIVLTNITTSTITEDIPTTTTKIATTCLLCRYPNDHPLDHNLHGCPSSSHSGCNEVIVPLWFKEICSYLKYTPWCMNGSSIIDIPNINLALSTPHYWSPTFYLDSSKLLEDAKLNAVKQPLMSTIKLNDCPKLLHKIQDFLLPFTAMDILDCIGATQRRTRRTPHVPTIYGHLSKLWVTPPSRNFRPQFYNRDSFKECIVNTNLSINWFHTKLMNVEISLKA